MMVCCVNSRKSVVDESYGTRPGAEKPKRVLPRESISFIIDERYLMEI